MLEEPQLNGRIASVISGLGRTLGWQVREELRGALRGPKTKPDILITRDGSPPIVLETEYPPANTLADDCLKSIGRELNPDVANVGGTVSSVIAIRATDALHQCETGDEAQQMLESGHEIGYAVYHGSDEEFTRFPKSGFIIGSVCELFTFIRPATEPQETIEAATQSFEEGVEDVAAYLYNAARNPSTDFGQRIGAVLRQPWPAYPHDMDPADLDPQQEAADELARKQTAKMAAAILINALAYHDNLSGYSVETQGTEGETQRFMIRGLDEVRGMTRHHPSLIIREWKNILNINYWSIFDIAIKVLMQIPPRVAGDRMLERAVSTAFNMRATIGQHDVAGTVLQKLIADRQTLATYYTRPESTILAANLAIPDDLDWGNPETVANYCIADYACGTGGLMLAAYQRIRELHRACGGDPDALHSRMMENSLTACDILPAAVHLTSSLLSSVAPNVQYRGTRNILYLYGATFALRNGARIPELNTRRRPRKYPNGDPVYKMDEIHVGSLELLDVNATMQQAAFPLSAEMAVGSRGENSPIEIDTPPLSQDLVIMNPPFTTPTNHAGDHAKPGNPAYAAFGTSKDEQNAMADKVKRLSRNTIGDGNAGLATQFAAIANNMVKSDGRIALVLPASSMFGGSDTQSGASWQKFRRMIALEYDDVIVISIAQRSARDSAFSADTNLAEVIVIARRLRAGESPSRMVRFVNLFERPQNALVARETVNSIRSAIAMLNDEGAFAEITVGNDLLGTVRLERVDPSAKWTTVRVANLDLLSTAEGLMMGSLRLPQRRSPVSIPVTRLRNIGVVGPLHRDISGGNQERGRGPFTRHDGADSGTEWPFLWSRRSDQQRCLITEPDSHGRIKPGRADEAHDVWSRASNLHISNECGFNSSPTCATYTELITAGGRAWPNVKMASPEMEKATCVWFNGTLGLISYWINSNRSQNARGGTTVSAIPFISTLDVSVLSDAQLHAAVAIFDDLGREPLLPTNEAYRDDIRQEIDRRILSEVLGLEDTSVEQLAILRNQWCREPTVVGTKRTGPDDVR